MKITKITTYVVTDHTLDVPRQGRLAWQWVFVKMETDEGVHGWGEAGASAHAAGITLGTAIEQVKEALIGENPMDTERLWHKSYRRFSYLGARGFGTSLTAAFDTALWAKWRVCRSTIFSVAASGNRSASTATSGSRAARPRSSTPRLPGRT